MGTAGIIEVEQLLRSTPSHWVVTGAAGFIGSNLVSHLLKLDQVVVGFDNFSTGFKSNIDEIRAEVTKDQWARFSFIEGDICDKSACGQAVSGARYVLHQAALGSVPKSIEDPLTWNRVNVDGFLNIMTAARDAKVVGFVYASSSSVYGDSPILPKVEGQIGDQLSPYAVSKYANELYAQVYSKCYGFSSIGLRYFNVFGRRQDPNGAYAAVIPKWISNMAANKQCLINGDGTTSRDFCYIANVVQANILCAVTQSPLAINRVYNVGVGKRTTLLDLHAALSQAIAPRISATIDSPLHGCDRPGDVKHSLASIDAIEKLIGYRATYSLKEGIADCIDWYLNRNLD